MLPDRVSNPGPLTYESGALLIALRSPAHLECKSTHAFIFSASLLSNSKLYGFFFAFLPKKLFQNRLYA